MNRLLRKSAVPAFLLLCLLLGGSGQGVLRNAALQLLAVLLLAWAAIGRRPESVTRASGHLLLFALAAVTLILLQLVPLPPGIWQVFPGRDLMHSGYGLLGYEPGWQPLSWAPYASLEAAYALLPPIAVAAAIVALRAYRESWVAGAILLGALASVLLGAVQVASAGQARWAYLYEYTNTGAVGFFANSNHMATLLIVAIPFAAALFASTRGRVRGRGSGFGLHAVGAGAFLLAVLGLVLNGSLAALALSVPVAALSLLILPAGWQWRRVLAPAALLALAASVVLLSSTSVGASLGGSADPGSLYSRSHMWALTVRAIAETFPLGTGLGTFPNVYPLHENPAVVDSTYVNHAHNDYLELLLETGVIGLLLALAFLGWWAWQAVRVWRSPVSSAFAKAATVASAAILAHSVVDYPLRTAAIAALFAACVAMMTRAQAQASRRSDRPRHVTIA